MTRKSKLNKGCGWRVLCGFNSATATVLALCLFAIVNYISFNHHFPVDISSGQFYSVSERSIAVLDQLEGEIDVTIFARQGHPAYYDAINLLDQYAAEQPLIKVRRIDPDRDVAGAQFVSRNYGIAETGVVIFDHAGTLSIVGMDEVFEDPVQQPDMISAENLVFKGEQLFTSAILNVISADRPKVYFIQGHGEGNPLDFDSNSGYSRIAQAIEATNVEVHKLVLGEVQDIPEDCDVLIVAGPSTSYSRQEVDLMRAYLEERGNMLVMLQSMREVGLTALMRDWGVDLGNDVVIDRSRTLTGRGLFITEYAPHPITEKLEGTSSIFYMPRSVEPIEGAEVQAADRARVTVLATSSPRGWAETDWHQTPMEYNPERDKAGSISVAAAVERGLPEDLDARIRPTRMVVFGDSSFVSNAGMAGANMDFFVAALDWLMEREELISIAPKIVGTKQLVLTGNQIAWLGASLVLGLPLIFAVIGSVVCLFRRF